QEGAQIPGGVERVAGIAEAIGAVLAAAHLDHAFPDADDAPGQYKLLFRMAPFSTWPSRRKRKFGFHPPARRDGRTGLGKGAGRHHSNFHTRKEVTKVRQNSARSPNMTRLSAAFLAQPRAGVQIPDYDRKQVRPGIVHLGIGAFHRAHMAVYVDDLLGRDPDWGIVGASLRRPDTKEALEPQDGLYTIAVRDAAGTHPRIIGSILRVMDANSEREDLLSLMADPAIRIVSLTVTEKGYCHDPATGELDETHPDIVHDLAHPGAPRSAPGMIVEALARRRAEGVVPFTVMSCDNLPSNGETA